MAKAWSGGMGFLKSSTKVDFARCLCASILPNCMIALSWSTCVPSASCCSRSSDLKSTTFLDDEARTRFRRNFIMRHPFTESNTGSWFDTSIISPSSEPDAELSDDAQLLLRRKLGCGRLGCGCAGRIRAPPGADPTGTAPPPAAWSHTYLSDRAWSTNVAATVRISAPHCGCLKFPWLIWLMVSSSCPQAAGLSVNSWPASGSLRSTAQNLPCGAVSVVLSSGKPSY
mmetsp:Transcript_94193/g.269726  ORF Transcript_94193/g.269726 Transcript_94193/m.269726 type:complete len:228 (-) Transcript_94193:449-1132(-)